MKTRMKTKMRMRTRRFSGKMSWCNTGTSERDIIKHNWIKDTLLLQVLCN